MTAMVRGSGEPPHKMAKLDTPLPANVIIQFQSDTGDVVGECNPHLDLLIRLCVGVCVFGSHSTLCRCLQSGSTLLFLAAGSALICMGSDAMWRYKATDRSDAPHMLMQAPSWICPMMSPPSSWRRF